EGITQAANKNILFKRIPNIVTSRKKKSYKEQSTLLQDTIKL
ncbi:11350_t:CDS:1, partial [Dentiscutata heterogama]